jgi:hypothetical protein
VNSICFDQADGAFSPGILAFTRVITADIIGVQVGTGTAATQVGQILDADIYFSPGNSTSLLRRLQPSYHLRRLTISSR